MEKQIVRYHEPQECGCPFFTIVSAETGQILETIDLPYPSGYWHDGVEFYEQPEFLYEETTKRLSNEFPEIGKKENYRFNTHKGKRTEFRVADSVEHIKDEFLNGVFLYHEYMVTYKYYTAHTEKRWDTSKDEYRKEMTALGYDMSKWHPYIRRKTEYKDFLRSLYPNALNMIFIG